MDGEPASCLTDALERQLGQPERFLTFWFGQPAHAPSPDGFDDLPEPLASWQRALRRWHPSPLRQNRLPEQRERDGGHVLVGVETQAVWLWGVRADSDDNEVWERENEPDALWTRTGESLHEFLWHFLLVEAVLGGDHGCALNNGSPQDLAVVTADCVRLAIKPWRWPGPEHALWQRGDALLWTMANDYPGSEPPHDSYSIFIAARSNEELPGFEDADINWD